MQTHAAKYYLTDIRHASIIEESVKAIYERYDASHTILRMISTRFERAIAILDTLDIASERTEYLRVFAENLMDRKK